MSKFIFSTARGYPTTKVGSFSQIYMPVVTIFLLSTLPVVEASDNASEVTFTEVTRGVVRMPAGRRSIPSSTPTGPEDPAAIASTDSVDQDQALSQPVEKILNRPPVQPKVTLQRVLFDGNTAIDNETLEALSNSFLHRPLRYSDLEQLRVEITRAYTSRGYINSGAFLPDQELSDGEITYEIIEGRIDTIDVSGTGRLKPQYVENRVRAGAGEPFNSGKLQESFQLLLDDPLIERMDGQLLPLPETGLTNLKLKVTPAAPVLLNLTADNHGSPSVGAEQLTLAGTYLNPTGYGDSANLSVSVSPGRYNLSASYSVPLNARDTRMKVDFGSTNSTVVEAPLDNIDIESESTNFSLSVSHPLRRSVRGSTKIGVDLTVRDNSNTLLGEPFSFSAGEIDGESRVAALRLWQDFTRRGPNQVIAFRSSFNIGLDALGSTAHDDDLPDSEFFAWLGQAQFVRSLQEGNGQFLLRADVQQANELLLPLERFALGGAGSVRGYRKNQLVRDQAIFASAEYRYAFHNSTELGQWQIAPFVDYGAGQNRGSDDSNNQTLLAAGAGLLWSRARYNAELYIGHAFKKVDGSTNGNLQDDGVQFRFSTRFY